jgi:hypothetical protein
VLAAEIVFQRATVLDQLFGVVDEGHERPAVRVSLVAIDVDDEFFPDLLCTETPACHLGFHDDLFCLEEEIQSGSTTGLLRDVVLGPNVVEEDLELCVEVACLNCCK